MLSLPSGCPFHPRCPYAMDECNQEFPPHVGSPGAYSACWWAAKHEGDSLEVAQ
jgi:oligopeptide/dipeptide ABC transporter ATP-binding protein